MCIRDRYRLRDTSFGKIDLNTFFIRLQEQNDTVASWSDSTITKLKQIIARVLVETEYLDNLKADHLNPVWLHPVLENAIRSNGDMIGITQRYKRILFIKKQCIYITIIEQVQCFFGRNIQTLR